MDAHSKAFEAGHDGASGAVRRVFVVVVRYDRWYSGGGYKGGWVHPTLARVVTGSEAEKGRPWDPTRAGSSVWFFTFFFLSPARRES